MSTQPAPTPLSESTPPKQDPLAKLKEGPSAWNAWLQILSQSERNQIDLSRADLTKCNFTDADLSGINLRGADCRDGNFLGTNLFQTNLRDADLRGTYLEKAKGCLLSRQFAGADLTGAKLPEPIAVLYDKLGSVNKISDSAKKLFLALLAACLYCWLTIGTTKDVDLITNRASSPLPVIQTRLPIVGFYIVAPIILLCIYFYFHFYLQKLWEELAVLPAVFADGRPLYVRADPWLFNDLVRAHFTRLKNERPFLSFFQQWISVLLAWWLVPITLLLFWARYLPRHDIKLAALLAVIMGISIVSAIRLYRLAGRTLQGAPRQAFTWRNAYTRGGINISWLTLCLLALLLISIHAMWRSPDATMPKLMGRLGYPPSANLTGADVSIKPPDWTGKDDDRLDLVKGADLPHKDFRRLSGEGAFLAKANLSAADFSRARLNSADLRKSDLTGANMSEAIIDFADLRDATLRSANLTAAHFAYSDLTGATFNVPFNYGKPAFTPTEIKYTDFRFASGLESWQIKSCQHWQMAFYDDHMLSELRLPPDHNDALEQYRKSGSQEPFDLWQLKWRQNKAAAPTTKPN